MPTPAFVLRLREKIGHDLLPMTGASGVVLDGDRLLLGRRVDTGQWALPSGILEPGGQPAAGVLREVEEETGVVAAVEALAAVEAGQARTLDNGDQVAFIDLCFRCRYVSGEARVGDDESLEVGWFPLDELPEGLSAKSRARLDRALAVTGTTWFEGLDGRQAPRTAYRP